MKCGRLEQMIGGWFIGNFVPTILRTPDVEVSVKHYKAGMRDPAHMHRIATEVTVIVSGRALLCGRAWNAGDIILIEPGEASEFVALTDVVLVAVKLPSVVDDKFPVEK